MIKTSVILFILIAFTALKAQNRPTAQAQSIVAEGKLLYKSEISSWHGTDIFLENYKDLKNIGGYFSYTENVVSKCIFYSKSENPKVIGTISFDSTFNPNTATIDLAERAFSETENNLYQIRNIAAEELKTNAGGLFKFYQNTNPNIIPLIIGKQRKVYILTGPKNNGVVIFGNDYLLTFNQNNALLSKKQIHNNIISIEFGHEGDHEVEGSVHTHLPETGDFITATDICTLMLYEKFAKWKTHNVVSKKYLNIWDCETDQLTVVPTSTVNKIKKDQLKRHPEKDDNVKP